MQGLVLQSAVLAAVGHTLTPGAVGQAGLVRAVAHEADAGVGQDVRLVLLQLPAQAHLQRLGHAGLGRGVIVEQVSLAAPSDLGQDLTQSLVSLPVLLLTFSGAVGDHQTAGAGAVLPDLVTRGTEAKKESLLERLAAELDLVAGV